MASTAPEIVATETFEETWIATNFAETATYIETIVVTPGVYTFVFNPTGSNINPTEDGATEIVTVSSSSTSNQAITSVSPTSSVLSSSASITSSYTVSTSTSSSASNTGNTNKPTATATDSATSSPTLAVASTLPEGAKAGIGVLAAIVVLLTAALIGVILFYRRKERMRARADNHQVGENDSPEMLKNEPRDDLLVNDLPEHHGASKVGLSP